MMCILYLLFLLYHVLSLFLSLSLIYFSQFPPPPPPIPRVQLLSVAFPNLKISDIFSSFVFHFTRYSVCIS